EVIALIEDLAVDVRVQFAELANLPVLLRDELLVERRDLDVEVVLGQEEVGREPSNDFALLVPFQVERARLVLPFDLIEVEEASELPLAGVGEADAIALQAVRSSGRGWVHDPPARTARR